MKYSTISKKLPKEQKEPYTRYSVLKELMCSDEYPYTFFGFIHDN